MKLDLFFIGLFLIMWFIFPVSRMPNNKPLNIIVILSVCFLSYVYILIREYLNKKR